MVRMLTLQASGSESLASQTIAMTWSKQYTSANPVLDVDTDSGTSYVAAMDELFDTWLPSRGWSCTTAATQPNASDGLYRWWIEKSIQCIDNSFYAHRVVVIHDPSGAEDIGWATWDSGIDADTDAPAQAFISALGNEIEGNWEFWTSDQDTDSFLILSTGINRGIIGFMPPTGSIHPAADWTTQYPSKNAPLFPSAGKNWWISAVSASTTTNQIETGSDSYSTSFAPASYKVNFASVASGTGSSKSPCFMTTTNDVASIVSVRDRTGLAVLQDANTMLIDGDYYIAIGTSANKLLLNTGTVDPQV
ncbi:MAG: hypothetical protein CMH53_04150 [Myxococcales bacterium]|nr:hypothetical protein [Myxococcales bacterium]